MKRLENGVVPYSKLEWFLDTTRPHVYLREEKHLPHLHRPTLKTFDEFMADVDAGFYETTARMTQPLRTVLDMLAMFPEWRDELPDMFNTRMPPPPQ